MAVNTSRSQRMSLMEGATDGKYRKSRPNTEVVSGMGNEHMMNDRSHLHPWWNYGYPSMQVPLAQRGVPGYC